MGTIRVNGSTSGYVELAAPAVAGSTVLTLPLGGFGKVLQVVRATDVTSRSTTSTSFTDVTGMSVTITPLKSTSAVLILMTGFAVMYSASSPQVWASFQITDSANTAVSGAEATRSGNALFTYTSTGEHYSPMMLVGYATPGTTSATTYKVRFKVQNTSATVRLDNNDSTGQLYALEISA